MRSIYFVRSIAIASRYVNALALTNERVYGIIVPGRSGGMADTRVLKTLLRKGVRVRVPSPAHQVYEKGTRSRPDGAFMPNQDGAGTLWVVGVPQGFPFPMP